MADVRESAEVSFRRLYRQDWAKFLESPMGISFMGVIMSRMPITTPSNISHLITHKSGEVFNWQQMFRLMFTDLKQQVVPIEQIPQVYPDETQSPQQET